MKCPTCQSLMTQGEITLEATLTDLAIGGGGFTELRFQEPKQKPVMVMAQSDSKPALSCKTCGHLLIINDLEYNETECVVCRTTMPAGVTSCPECGWTYEVSAE